MWHVDFEDVQGHPGDKIGDDDANDDDEVDGDDDDLTYELIECGGPALKRAYYQSHQPSQSKIISGWANFTQDLLCQ